LLRENFSIVIIIFILLFSGGLSVADEISVSSRISTTELAYEEEVTLIVELKWVGSITSYSFSIMPLPTADNLKVAGSSSTISSAIENGADVTIRKFKYNFIPTLAGKSTIHPVTFDYISWPDSIPGQLSTQEFNLFVAEPIPKVKESGNAIYFYLILAFLFTAGGGLTVFLLISRSKRVEKEVPIEESFVEQLGEIKKESHADRKAFFGKLYRLLLWYLESKYLIEVKGKTVQTVINSIEEQEISFDNKERIVEILKQSDLEKFAPSRGEPGDILRLCAELESYFGKINDNNISEAK